MESLGALLYTLCLSALTQLRLASSTPEAGRRDYCQPEYFNVSCRTNQVILMEHALYGRMKQGRCITSNYGNIGCSEDVLPYMHSQCSGLQSCNLYVGNPTLHNTKTGCPKDFTPYLEAAYTCLQVAGPDNGGCRGGRGPTLPVTTTPGYISSHGRGPLGTARCPWILQAEEGQTIQISLLAFSAQPDTAAVGGGRRVDRCFKIGLIMETELHELKLCVPQRARGEHRQEVVYSSRGSSVSVELLSKEVLQGVGPFILKYQAVGCPRLKNPPGGYVKVTDTTAEVHCNNSQDTWYLTCQGTEWQGKTGNCSKSVSSWSQTGILDSDSHFPYGILIVVAIGVALGVFIGGLLLSLAAVYMKRKNRPYEDPAEIAPSMDVAYGTHIRAVPHDMEGQMVFKDMEHIREQGVFDDPSQNILCPKHDVIYGRQCSQHSSYNGTASLKSGHFYESPHLG